MFGMGAHSSWAINRVNGLFQKKSANFPPTLTPTDGIAGGGSNASELLTERRRVLTQVSSKMVYSPTVPLSSGKSNSSLGTPLGLSVLFCNLILWLFQSCFILYNSNSNNGMYIYKIHSLIQIKIIIILTPSLPSPMFLLTLCCCITVGYARPGLLCVVNPESLINAKIILALRIQLQGQ